MPITQLAIKGFRGFSEEQTLSFGRPTGKPGSGLTVLVGPNNGGKSTVIESLQALSSRQEVSFSEGKRNKLAGDRVSLRLHTDGVGHELRTVDTEGSQTIREPNESLGNCYVLPSRRFFNPYFGSGATERQNYVGQHGVPHIRSNPSEAFSQRLFRARANLTEFNQVFKRVIDPAPVWTIDQADQGSYYLKTNADGQYHNSDGLGEGIISLLFIVDALYDSRQGDLIAIDEPELSLHPAYQRRLASLFADYAKDRQIVYATHSPYFVDFVHVLNGAEVARVHRRDGGSTISQLKWETAEKFKGVLTDSYNPHILGLDAREVFFREDGIVVCEGQEDIVLYPMVLEELVKMEKLNAGSAEHLQECFFGWGAGGADNIGRIVALLHDLGFDRVAGIFDNNKCQLIPDLKKEFPDYVFCSIPADDVRTKLEIGGQAQILGLLDRNNSLRPEYADATGLLFNEVATMLSGNTH